MARCAQNDNSNSGMRSRWSGTRRADVTRHDTTYEFPSLWESMEEDVSDHFDDWWRL